MPPEIPPITAPRNGSPPVNAAVPAPTTALPAIAAPIPVKPIDAPIPGARAGMNIIVAIGIAVFKILFKLLYSANPVLGFTVP